mmetsp:Transcript_21764/g.42284  ORF Transcript_21764/g.42284 Transcript_21764/m.42284 type:complete len:167 (-) Transcript_21764:216-716(-)
MLVLDKDIADSERLCRFSSYVDSCMSMAEAHLRCLSRVSLTVLLTSAAGDDTWRATGGLVAFCAPARVVCGRNSDALRTFTVLCVTPRISVLPTPTPSSLGLVRDGKRSLRWDKSWVLERSRLGFSRFDVEELRSFLKRGGTVCPRLEIEPRRGGTLDDFRGRTLW